MPCSQAMTTFAGDLHDAITNTTRMAVAEGHSPHAEHLRQQARGLQRARRMFVRACAEHPAAPEDYGFTIRHLIQQAQVLGKQLDISAPAHMKPLVALQREILAALWALVAEGKP
jgi:hypothetical protein